MSMVDADLSGAAPEGEDQDRIVGKYKGDGQELFWLALKTGLLTLVTFGIYRFWQKTRIRRYMWSATAPGGHPFEYNGTGLEKFLGFLVAITVLVVYLAVFQLLLFAIGLSIIPQGNSNTDILLQTLATYLTLLALLPLIFYAQYRGRRYILSRTRWRGVRFGADKAAWGYMGRALGYTLLNIITLGLLSPLATFKLEVFLTDRTWYGDAKFQQGGTWTMLYKHMKHVFIGLGICVLSGLLWWAVGGGVGGALGGLGLFVGYVWMIVGYVYYGVESFNELTRYKLLGDNIRFNASVSTSTVIGRWLIGYFVVPLIVGVAMIPLIIVFAILGAAIGAGAGGMMDPDAFIEGGAGVGMMIMIVFAYLFAIVLGSALWLVFVTQRIAEHYVEEITIFNAQELDSIRQRVGHDQVDAEGFADALDVGAAF